jgi:stringent starvation protein B
MNSFDMEIPSTRPYLIRALHEWCVESGFSPYIAVQVDASVKVPMEFVKNSEIVLNIGIDATNALRLGNDFIEFNARFGGVAREIIVPVSHVIAIYARENGQGMAFPAPVAATVRLANEFPLDEVAESVTHGDMRGASDTADRQVLRAVTTEGGAADGEEPPAPVPDGPSRVGGRPQLTRIK